jgi:alpha-tubulin suppressor-like RCC1 family protein
MRLSRFQGCITSLAILLLLSCGGGERATGPAPIAPPPSVKQVLTTTLSRGVAGSPVQGAQEVNAGSVVSYAFTTSPGYQNVRVLLDGAPATTSGQLVMDKPHSIVASADTAIALSKSDSSLVKQIEQLVINASPAELSRQLDKTLDSLLAGSSPEAGVKTLGHAIALAIVPNRDAEKLSQALAISATGQASRTTSSQDAYAGPSPHTVLLYVNGINALPTDYKVAWRGSLYPLAQRRGITVAGGFDVGGFYNPSVTFNDPAVATFWSCVLLAGSQIANGIGSALTNLLTCMPILGLVINEKRYPFGDFVEALAQVVNLAVFKQSALVQPDAIRLADSLLAVRRRGERVVLVAHSQGNLLAEEALLRLSATSSWTSQDRSCVGWVAVAPPKAPSTALTGIPPSAMIIRGAPSVDILEAVFGAGGNPVVRPVRNELSDDYDSQGWFWSRILGWFGYGTGVALHSIVQSYFGMPATEKLIGDALLAQVDALDSQCLSPTAALQITSNAATTWTVIPGVIVGSGTSGTALIRAARLGTEFTLSPATLSGRTVSVSSSDGPGPRVTVFPGDTKSFTITYTSIPSTPTVTLLADPTTILLGQFSTLRWSSSGADSCSAPWTSSTAISGTESVTPTTTTVYTISCSSPSGAGSSQATVTVGSNGVQFLTITAGYAHSCASTTTATYCWGWNVNGGVGDGTRIDRFTPTVVSGGQVFQTLALGKTHSCGLTANGTAYCWGNNADGQLGDGTNTTRTTPVAVAGALVFQKLAAGDNHTCGVAANGAIYCWGDNYNGQLGDATTNDRLVPALVATNLTFKALASGASHTCAVTTLGAAYCWGWNGNGELGNGTASNISVTPVAVFGGFSFTSLAAGHDHTCGLTTTGVSYCWGSSTNGQLGIPGLYSLTPAAVTGGLVFQKLVAADDHTCAITNLNNAHCWGWGGLGIGATVQSSTPVAVAGGLTFQELASGYHFSCGITTSSAAYCWGENSGSGQLGNGTGVPHSTPFAVSSP